MPSTLFCLGMGVVLFSLAPPTLSFSRGASRTSCQEMIPGHIRAQPQDPQHSFVTLRTSASSYLPGQLITGSNLIFISSNFDLHLLASTWSINILSVNSQKKLLSTVCTPKYSYFNSLSSTWSIDCDYIWTSWQLPKVKPNHLVLPPGGWLQYRSCLMVGTFIPFINWVPHLTNS